MLGDSDRYRHICFFIYLNVVEYKNSISEMS